MAGSCDSIVEFSCEAINLAALNAYEQSSAQVAAATSIAAGCLCLADDQLAGWMQAVVPLPPALSAAPASAPPVPTSLPDPFVHAALSAPPDLLAVPFPALSGSSGSSCSSDSSGFHVSDGPGPRSAKPKMVRIPTARRFGEKWRNSLNRSKYQGHLRSTRSDVVGKCELSPMDIQCCVCRHAARHLTSAHCHLLNEQSPALQLNQVTVCCCEKEVVCFMLARLRRTICSQL